MTITRADAEELTCEEIHAGFDALINRTAELATERDHAQAERADLLEANCRLQQERDQETVRADANAGRADFNAHLAGAFRNDLDDVRTELRRTRGVCRELAVVKIALERQRDALEQQIDRMQNPPEPRPDDHTRRWPFGRLGNQL